MEDTYARAMQLYDQKEYGSAGQLFEQLIDNTPETEDRAYLFLHLFRCLKYLGIDDKAHEALARGRELAPCGSRFPLDSGIEEAVYLTEKGRYVAAMKAYKCLLAEFSDLLARHDEEPRRQFIQEQLSKLKDMTRDIV
jgi:tetratricopeptide (TPR) repeat protein